MANSELVTYGIKDIRKALVAFDKEQSEENLEELEWQMQIVAFFCRKLVEQHHGS